MIIYDTIIYAESQAANGLTATAAKGPTNIGYTISGDTIILKDLPDPKVYRAGMIGDTKPLGFAIKPSNGNANQYQIMGPGAINHSEVHVDLRKCPDRLWQNDTLTGYTDSTNVNEGSVMWADIAYGDIDANWDLSAFAGAKIYYIQTLVTSAAAVTFNSGADEVYDCAQTKVQWFDPSGTYYLLGVMGVSPAAATYGGVLTVTNLPGDWHGYSPGVPINANSAVTFTSGQNFTPFLEPLGPISGSALKNNVQIGMTATSAGAQYFILVIARVA